MVDLSQEEESKYSIFI